jgi:TP901 family phage tail tape measure protein
MTVSAKREARVELRSSASGMGEGIREARRQLKQLERDQTRATRQAEREAKAFRKRMLTGGRGIAGGVAQGMELALGATAAGGLAGMASDVLDYEKALTRLQITASSSPEVMRELSRTIGTASLVTGIHRNEILSAASAYVALTGDLNTARSSTATWAKIAAATGSTVSDIAQTAAALSQQMGIGPKNMEATFSALAQQGKAGAIELKDLAGVMSQIAPMWAMFKGGSGVEGVRQLGAALQIVKRGFGGDAGETVTGLQGLLVALTKNAARFQGAGIRVFDVDRTGKQTMRDVFSLVDAISKSDLVKHPDLLEKAFGRVEAYRAYVQLAQNRTELHRFVEEARDAGLIQRDFLTYLESPSARMEKSWNAVKLAVADALTPERIQRFAGAIEGVATKLGTVTDALGLVADGLGALHGAGRSIRSFLTPDDSRLRASSPEEIARVANDNHISEADAVQALQADYGRSLALKRKLLAATPDDRPTLAATKLAIAAEQAPMRPGITDEYAVARAYIQGAGVTPAQYHELVDQVRGEQLDADIAAGRGRSTQPDNMEAAFLAALKAGAPEIGRSVAQAIAKQPPNIKIGSEPLVKATKNAPTLNTRPGGRP